MFCPKKLCNICYGWVNTHHELFVQVKILCFIAHYDRWTLNSAVQHYTCLQIGGIYNRLHIMTVYNDITPVYCNNDGRSWARDCNIIFIIILYAVTAETWQNTAKYVEKIKKKKSVYLCLGGNCVSCSGPSFVR